MKTSSTQMPKTVSKDRQGNLWQVWCKNIILPLVRLWLVCFLLQKITSKQCPQTPGCWPPSDGALALDTTELRTGRSPWGTPGAGHMAERSAIEHCGLRWTWALPCEASRPAALIRHQSENYSWGRDTGLTSCTKLFKVFYTKRVSNGYHLGYKQE